MVHSKQVQVHNFIKSHTKASILDGFVHPKNKMQSNCSGSQLNTVRRDEIVVNFGTVHVNSSKLKSVTIFATSGTFCISGSICRDVSCPEILLPFRVKRGEPFVANFTWQPSQAYDLNHRIHFRSQSGALLVISIIGRSESRSPRMWSLDHRKKQLELDGRMKIKAATLIQKCWKRYKMRETVSKKWAEMAAQLKQLDGVAKVIQRWWRTARVRKNQVLMKRPSAEVLIYDKLPNLLSWLFTSSGQISAELQVESCPLFDTETLIIDLKCAKKFMKDLDRVRCDLRELVQLLDENGIRNKCQNNWFVSTVTVQRSENQGCN